MKTRPGSIGAGMLAGALLLAGTVGCSEVNSARSDSHRAAHHASVVENRTGALDEGHRETDHEVEQIPATEDEFVAMRNTVATDPHGACVMFVVALEMYARDAELGEKVLSRMIDVDQLVVRGGEPALTGTQIREFADTIGSKPYIAHSYFQSTSPGNGYEMGSAPWTIRIRQQSSAEVGEETAKLFVFSTGADSPRPLSLRVNNRGIWKVREWSSLRVGIREPGGVVDDNY